MEPIMPEERAYVCGILSRSRLFPGAGRIILCLPGETASISWQEYFPKGIRDGSITYHTIGGRFQETSPVPGEKSGVTEVSDADYFVALKSSVADPAVLVIIIWRPFFRLLDLLDFLLATEKKLVPKA